MKTESLCASFPRRRESSLLIAAAGLLLLVLFLLAPLGADQTALPAADPSVRFLPVHVYLDTKGQPLAAYQFEMKANGPEVKIVGVEGGEHAAYKNPPYYDPAALMQNRIILAAFSTDETLPTGKTRIATLHLQVTGPGYPDFATELTVTASADGRNIPANLTLNIGDQP
jgi:hypothetical protein